jgi:steroid delta-isomerase
MPGPTEIRAIVTAYVEMMCETRVDDIMELFDHEATAEDPVGGELVRGIEALRNFYGAAAPMLQVELSGPICVAGNQCAFPVQAQLTMGDNVSYLDATDNFVFNEAGKITSMRAFWNPEELRPERQANTDSSIK